MQAKVEKFVMAKKEKFSLIITQNTVDYNIQDGDEKVILSNLKLEIKKVTVEGCIFDLSNPIYLLCIFKDVNGIIYDFILKIDTFDPGEKYVFDYFYPYNEIYKEIINSNEEKAIKYNEIMKNYK